MTDNSPTIDNSNAKDQACQIEVSFTGSYGRFPMAERPNSSAGRLFGIGFSVNISGLSGNVALRSKEKEPKPKGTWLVEQWVAHFNFKMPTH